MMAFLVHYGGDLLWAIAMGVMANFSRLAFLAIPPGTPTPAPWNFWGAKGPRAPRALALVFTPTIAFLVGAALVVVAATHRTVDSAAIIIFGARALLAALFALAHLTHLRGALNVLEAEGKLRS
jgi:hypothetical protein